MTKTKLPYSRRKTASNQKIQENKPIIKFNFTQDKVWPDVLIWPLLLHHALMVMVSSKTKGPDQLVMVMVSRLQNHRKILDANEGLKKTLARWRPLPWFQFRPPSGTTCISYKFVHQVVPLALPHCFRLSYRHDQLVSTLYLHQPESHQFSLQNLLDGLR